MIYIDLFLSFFQIGLFSIGGGYAAMPLIQNHVVDIHRWLSMKEFADVVTISSMTPGPIAINSATFVGIRVAGFPGALAATAGCVLPSCIIVMSLAYIYYKFRSGLAVKGVLKGLRPAVIALIASAGLTLVILAFWNGNDISSDVKNIDVIAIAIFSIGILILRKWKLNPIIIMVSAGIIGLCVYPFVL